MKEIFIEKIEEIDEEVEVFDIQLAKGHNFVAEGILVHNCELCKSLDGQVVDSNSPEYTIYQPSLHPRCRCTWVPVKSDAPNIPDVNFEKPSNDLITKYAPFWFLIPDKEKDKKKILPIDDMWYSNEAPELFFNTKDVLSIEQYIYETEQRKIEGDYGQQG